jgi:RNA polymerase sigma factor (TIGR02999 family)
MTESSIESCATHQAIVRANTPTQALALHARFAEHHEALRHIARSRLRRFDGLTLLDSADLVNEVFVKLGRATPPIFADDQHFLAYLSTAMRSLTIDYARARGSQRQGGGALHTQLETGHAQILDFDAHAQGLLDLDEALNALRSMDARLAEVVEMRFFGGFTEQEIGTALQVSSRTIKRDWEKARALLLAMLADA